VNSPNRGGSQIGSPGFGAHGLGDGWRGREGPHDVVGHSVGLALEWIVDRSDLERAPTNRAGGRRRGARTIIGGDDRATRCVERVVVVLSFEVLVAHGFLSSPVDRR